MDRSALFNARPATRRGAAGAYRSESVRAAEFASPHELVAMLMDGAIERIAQARAALEQGSVGRKGELIGRAIAIVDSLRASLDIEQGGEIADNLAALYEYVERRLLEANLHSDVSALDEVLRLLREIRSGWAGIAETRTAGGTAG